MRASAENFAKTVKHYGECPRTLKLGFSLFTKFLDTDGGGGMSDLGCSGSSYSFCHPHFPFPPPGGRNGGPSYEQPLRVCTLPWLRFLGLEWYMHGKDLDSLGGIAPKIIKLNAKVFVNKLSNSLPFGYLAQLEILILAHSINEFA
ncbi:hypothetical protein Tco_0887917 [Tanacetum coccineum]